jgi:hypothetical protein
MVLCGADWFVATGGLCMDCQLEVVFSCQTVVILKHVAGSAADALLLPDSTGQQLHSPVWSVCLLWLAVAL